MTDEPRPPLEPILLPGESRAADSGSPASSALPPGDGGRRISAGPGRRPPRWRLPLILFLLSCATTYFAGVRTVPEPVWVIDPVTGKKEGLRELDPTTGRETGRVVINWRQTLLNGLTYSIAVMALLAAHEAGHYLQARRYHVPASLPMFIPMPIGPLGTMGAVIFQQPGVADRKSLFDIAISGPLAGLVVALPLSVWGIMTSEIEPFPPGREVRVFANPRIVEWMIAWIHRPLQPGEDVSLNPFLHAGWVGIIITAINLIPIGQLDGGHILFCLIGKKAHLVARGLYVGAMGFIIYQVLQGHIEYGGWSLMLILLWLMGTRHPPTANDDVPLGKFRIVLGWLTLAFILVGFVPAPIYDTQGPAEEKAPVQEAPKVARQTVISRNR